jgi:hypothetical protein
VEWITIRRGGNSSGGQSAARIAIDLTHRGQVALYAPVCNQSKMCWEEIRLAERKDSLEMDRFKAGKRREYRLKQGSAVLKWGRRFPQSANIYFRWNVSKSVTTMKASALMHFK